MTKLYKDKSTPENRRFWVSAEKAAEEVETWPDWKKPTGLRAYNKAVVGDLLYIRVRLLTVVGGDGPPEVANYNCIYLGKQLPGAIAAFVMTDSIGVQFICTDDIMESKIISKFSSVETV